MAGSSDRVSVEEGVVFGVGGGQDLRCDVYARDGRSSSSPAVVLIAGGGSERDRGALRAYGIQLGRRGYVCICPEYRLVLDGPSWPAPLHDVKAAIRWVRASSARLGVDPARIAVQGHSAGALFALLAAGTSATPELEGNGGNSGVDSDVAAVVVFYPGTDLTRGEGGQLPLALFGPQSTAEQLRTASPVTYVGAGFPPTLLMHGAADRAAAPSQSERMYRALEEAGVPTELHLFAGQGHGFDSRPEFRALSACVVSSFLGRYLAESAG